MNLPFVLPRLPAPARGVPALTWGSLTRKDALRWAIVALLASALFVAGWLWLRNSSLVSVQEVKISGVSGPQAAQIEAALRTSAKGMTTLHFDEAALKAAVAGYPVVRALRASTSFPHGVHVTVVERLPVASLVADGQSTAVAADGTALGPALLSSALPRVEGSLIPSAGAKAQDAKVLAAVTVLGAAPSSVARFIAKVYTGPEGLTVAMRNGLLVYFGDATRPHAKWLSLASVLSDPSSAGATYVDVRVPGRPAAGHGSGALAGQAGTTGSAQTGALGIRGAASGEAAVNGAAGASDPAAAVLAERLANTVGGEAISTQAATSPEEGEHSGASGATGVSGGASSETSAEGRGASSEGGGGTTASPVESLREGPTQRASSPREGASEAPTSGPGGGTSAP